MKLTIMLLFVIMPLIGFFHPAGALASETGSLRGGDPRPPDVRRGDRLILSTHVGTVEARVDAEALSDGAIGEIIRVKNLQSGRVQGARVVKPGVAEVLH